VSVKPNRLTPLSNANHGPHVSDPEQGTLASVADLWDPPKPSLSSAYKSDQPVGIFPPFCCFFPLIEVSTAAHSSPVSRCLAQPFADYFGIGTPQTVIGQELRPPPLIPWTTSTDVGELLLLWFLSPMRLSLMSTLPMCSSGTELGTSSLT
jgi:hypothetical protein